MHNAEEYLQGWKEFSSEYFKGLNRAPYKHEIFKARQEFQNQKNKTIMSEIKTAKVTRVNATKPWEGNHGTIHYCQCEMDNGDKIEIGKKSVVQEGWELTYSIVDTSQEWNKAKAEQKPNQQPYQPSKSNDSVKGIKIGHAITNGVNMYVALGGNGKEAKEAIKDYSKLIYQISEELNQEL